MIGDDISLATSIKNPDPDNPLRIMLIPDDDHQQKWVKKYGTLVTETRNFFIEQENNMNSLWYSRKRPSKMVYPDVGPKGISCRNAQEGIDLWKVTYPDCSMG